MKTILQTLIAVAAFLIQTSYVNGQYTYQTAVRVGDNTSILTDSNVVLQPGIGIGCDTVTSQPVWMWFGFCSSGTTSLAFGTQSSSWPSIGVVIYGPFTDTLNLSSKLINANIDTCFTGYQPFGGWHLDSFNYERGDIYYILMTTTTDAYIAQATGFGNLPQSDTLLCPLCNDKLSQLKQLLCTVTYDSASQKNKLIWTKDLFTAAQDYVIFRENAIQTFDTVGFQSVSQLSEYVDATSSPIAKSHVYRLGIKDSCGQFVNNLNGSNTITTMHLIAYPTGNNSAGLIWNPGTFSGPFLIYRTDPSGITTLIDSVGIAFPITYTDINAPAGMCSYQIAVNLNPPCVASIMPSYTIVKSNPGYVTVTGINELADLSKAISIEPNPFNQFTKIDLHLITKQNIKVILRNLTGQVVIQFDNVKTDELIIERNNLSQGLYFLEVTGDNFYARKKLVVD